MVICLSFPARDVIVLVNSTWPDGRNAIESGAMKSFSAWTWDEAPFIDGSNSLMN